MDAVNDFKSIRRKLERQEQKAEFEAKNPPPPWTPNGGYVSPFGDDAVRPLRFDRVTEIRSEGLKMNHGCENKES